MNGEAAEIRSERLLALRSQCLIAKHDHVVVQKCSPDLVDHGRSKRRREVHAADLSPDGVCRGSDLDVLVAGGGSSVFGHGTVSDFVARCAPLVVPP